jgi:uncharacterized Zn finger protein (UPF0148 family)
MERMVLEVSMVAVVGTMVIEEKSGFCVCPQCGYSEPHRAGTPCRTVYCPECNLPLVRNEIGGNKTSANSTYKSSTENVKKDIVEKKERKITFPKVDTEMYRLSRMY